MKNACVTTLFAEDFRREVTDQVTLVGVFDDTIDLPKMPVDDFRISMFTTLSTLVDDPFCPSSFRVFLSSGETLLTEDLPEDLAAAQGTAIAKQKEVDPAQPWLAMRLIVQMRRVKLTEDASLGIEFSDSKGQTARSNLLQVKQKPISYPAGAKSGE